MTLEQINVMRSSDNIIVLNIYDILIKYLIKIFYIIIYSNCVLFIKIELETKI